MCVHTWRSIDLLNAQAAFGKKFYWLFDQSWSWQIDVGFTFLGPYFSSFIFNFHHTVDDVMMMTRVIFKLVLDDVLELKILLNRILCLDHGSLPNSTPQLWVLKEAGPNIIVCLSYWWSDQLYSNLWLPWVDEVARFERWKFKFRKRDDKCIFSL